MSMEVEEYIILQQKRWEERRFYVYTLESSLDGIVFYVGKGTDYRIKDHEREARNGVQSPKCDHIRQIEANGGYVVRKVVKDKLTNDEALKLEAELIKQYGKENLTNVGLERRQDKKPVRTTVWLNGDLLEQVAECMELDGIEYTHNACQQYVHDICLEALNRHIQKKEIKAYMDAKII